jgi:hypothetical protein
VENLLPAICFRPDLFQQVPWGYRLWPSRVFEHRYPPKGPNIVKVVSNSDGFRSAREFGDADPRERVVVLGDSLVFGEGVDESERFTDVMEQGSPDRRIDNLGMIGYGPDLMLRAFEAVGMWARPDLVVVSIYTDDLRRVAPYYAGVGFPIPRFVLRDGELTTIDYPEPHLWDRTRFFQGSCTSTGAIRLQPSTSTRRSWSGSCIGPTGSRSSWRSCSCPGFGTSPTTGAGVNG